MDHIVEHEHWQHSSFIEFSAGFFLQKGHGRLPPLTAAQNLIEAKINQGRWIVECPNTGCGGALCISSRQPYFICLECASPENGGRWYRIHFPPQKKVIEGILLKRPARDPWLASNRNWAPSETVAELRAENRARGLGD